MRFGYEEYVRRVLKLVGVNFESVVKGRKSMGPGIHGIRIDDKELKD